MTLARSILAFDSAGAACSAAVWREGQILAHSLVAMERGQAEQLVPMIEAVMAEAGLDYATLDTIAVTRGPGGFTGVRIGLATARGLALATGKPLIGVTNFEAVAAAVPEEERRGSPLVVLLNAKRKDLYVQVFGPVGAGAPASCLPAELAANLPGEALLLAGDGVAQAEASLKEAGCSFRVSAAPGLVDAKNVAAVAAGRALPEPAAVGPEPLYLRQADVTLPSVMVPKFDT